MPQIQIGRYRFRPRLLPSMVCLLVFCCLLGLGRWQWQRADYKEGLRQQFRIGSQADPLQVATASQLGRDIQGFPVLVQGRFDNQHSLLLDNQIRNKVPGFHVITPLLLDSGGGDID